VTAIMAKPAKTSEARACAVRVGHPHAQEALARRRLPGRCLEPGEVEPHDDDGRPGPRERVVERRCVDPAADRDEADRARDPERERLQDRCVDDERHRPPPDVGVRVASLGGLVGHPHSMRTLAARVDPAVVGRRAICDEGRMGERIEIVECVTEEGLRRAWAIVHQLRDRIDEREYLRRVEAARGSGYRLFGGRLQGEIVAALGVRRDPTLAWGDDLYVNDLVVDDAQRSRGIGEAMLAFAAELARSEGCAAVRLDSGLGRERAHSFYEREGYPKMGFMFRKEV